MHVRNSRNARKNREKVSNGEAPTQNDAAGRRRTIISLLKQKKSAETDVKSTLIQEVSNHPDTSRKKVNFLCNKEEKKVLFCIFFNYSLYSLVVVFCLLLKIASKSTVIICNVKA